MNPSQVTSTVGASSKGFQWPVMDLVFPDNPSRDWMKLINDAPYISDSLSDHTTGHCCDVRGTETNSQSSTDRSRLIKDRAEAHLLRHYCRTLAPWV